MCRHMNRCLQQQLLICIPGMKNTWTNLCCVSIPSEENLKASYVTTPCERLFKFQVSKCTPQILLLFPLFGGCYYPLWPHISQDSLCAWKKKKEREKLATFHGVDRDFCEPGQPKSWRKGKTSGEATRKCSNANNNGWRGSQGLAEGLAFKDRKGWVGQWRRMQTLNWDTTLKVLNGLHFTQQLIWDSVASSGKVSNQLNTPRLTLPETNLIISGTIQNQPAVCPNITKSDWAKLTSYRLPLHIYRTDMSDISPLILNLTRCIISKIQNYSLMSVFLWLQVSSLQLYNVRRSWESGGRQAKVKVSAVWTMNSTCF